MTQKKTYTIIVNRQRIPVSKEVYNAYHKEREAERYKQRLIYENEYSLERFQEMGDGIEYRCAACKDIAEELIRGEVQRQLHHALQSLSPEEHLLIYQLFYEGKSERELSAMIGVPQKTINDRKQKILKKLRRKITI